MGAENYWPWGPSSGDLNADGWEDIFVASSMNFPFRYGINSLLLNNQGQKFLDAEFLIGRGAAGGGKHSYALVRWTVGAAATPEEILQEPCKGRTGRLQ